MDPRNLGSLRAPGVALATRDYRRTTLGEGQRQVVAALAEAFFAHDGEPSEGDLSAFVDDVDAFLSPASKTLRATLKLSLILVRISPLFLARTLTSFPDLPLAERSKVVERMERASFIGFVLVFAAWKTVLSFLYFEPQAELARVGYPGPARRRYRLGLAPSLADHRETTAEAAPRAVAETMAETTNAEAAA